MTKLTPEQEAIMAQLEAADLAWREAKATAEQRAKIAAEKEVESAFITRNLLSFQAREAEISVVQISRRGLHTKATSTGYASIEAGEKYAPKKKATGAQEIPMFAWVNAAAGVVRVTPPLAEIAPLLPLLDLTPEAYADMPTLHFADFKIGDEGAVTALTPAWDDDFGRHPVVALVTGEDAALRHRIVEWAA